MRTLRWFLVAAVSLSMIGAAGLAMACDDAKASNASAEAKATNASADAGKASCSSKAEKANASFAGGQGCSAKTVKAQADADCNIHAFVQELNTCSEKVNVSLTELENGISIVFASANGENVEAAQALATKTFELMNAPAHCSMSREAMASKCCGGCAEALQSFAGAVVTVENTETGAVTTISTEAEGGAEKLQAFFRSLQEEPVKVESEG